MWSKVTQRVSSLVLFNFSAVSWQRRSQHLSRDTQISVFDTFFHWRRFLRIHFSITLSPIPLSPLHLPFVPLLSFHPLNSVGPLRDPAQSWMRSSIHVFSPCSTVATRTPLSPTSERNHPTLHPRLSYFLLIFRIFYALSCSTCFLPKDKITGITHSQARKMFVRNERSQAPPPFLLY